MNTIVGNPGNKKVDKFRDAMVVTMLTNRFGLKADEAKEVWDKAKEVSKGGKFTPENFVPFIPGVAGHEMLGENVVLTELVRVANGGTPSTDILSVPEMQAKGWVRRTLDRVRSTRVTEKEISTALVTAKENAGIQVDDRTKLASAPRQTPQVMPLPYQQPGTDQFVSRHESTRNNVVILGLVLLVGMLTIAALVIVNISSNKLGDTIVTKDHETRGYVQAKVEDLEKRIDQKFALTQGDIAGVKTDVENIVKPGGAIDTKMAALETRLNTRIDARVESGVQKGLATSIKAAVAELTAAAAAQQDVQAAGEATSGGDSVAANPTNK